MSLHLQILFATCEKQRLFTKLYDALCPPLKKLKILRRPVRLPKRIFSMFESAKPTKGILLEHMVFQKTRTQNLADVKALNMWGYELEDVTIIGRMVNAETIALPINKITTLAPFATCRNLRNLLLRQNQISDFSELDYLQGLDQLTNLSLNDNPIAYDPNYREIVISKLPQLRKLDDIDVSVKAPVRRACENVRFEQQQPVAPINVRKGLLRKSESSGMKKQFNLSALTPDFEEPPRKSARPEVPPMKPTKLLNPTQMKRSGDDSNMLTAVLSLIPELSANSLQIVLEAIQERCM